VGYALIHPRLLHRDPRKLLDEAFLRVGSAFDEGAVTVVKAVLLANEAWDVQNVLHLVKLPVHALVRKGKLVFQLLLSPQLDGGGALADFVIERALQLDLDGPELFLDV
jgi:hypothetical protein